MAEKKQKWEVLTSDFVGAVIAFEGLAVAKMQGENQLKTANEIVSLLNETENIITQRNQAYEILRSIRNYLKADENENTFDEVVRKLEREIKKSSELNEELQAKIKESERLKSENANLKVTIEQAKKTVRKAMDELKVDIKQIIIETFS